MPASSTAAPPNHRAGALFPPNLNAVINAQRDGSRRAPAPPNRDVIAKTKAKIFQDPRHYQIAVLSLLLAFGVALRAFDIAPVQIAATIAAALFAQFLGAVMTASRFDPRSALITALSLSLLLRADAIAPLVIAALIGVGSKYMLRFDHKHVFNPANAGIVALLLLSEGLLPDAAWTTPGQWGTALWFAMLLAGAGMFVTYRAARIDVPLIFLGVLAALTFLRAIWLGDPLAIPLLRLQNGALILFAFFMISDPKTTPDGTGARAIFAASAAVIAYILTYHFYIADGLFYALAIVCIMRPVLERLDPAPRYQWGDPVRTPSFLPFAAQSPKGSPPLPAE